MKRHDWKSVPFDAINLARDAAPLLKVAHEEFAPAQLVWCDPHHDFLYAHTAGEPGPAAASPRETWLLLKRAEGAPLAPVATLAGWRSGLWPSAPNVATATLGSGLLGAGMGYGAGWLAEQLLPQEYFEKGKLRRLGAVLGGVGGVMPPLWAGYHGWFDPDDKNMHAPPPVRGPGRAPSTAPPTVPPPPRALTSAGTGGEDFVHAAAAISRAMTAEEREVHPWYAHYANLMKLAWAADGGLEGSGGATALDSIPVDSFNQAIWRDPYTSPAVAATASGVVQGASAVNGSTFVSPLDVARIGVGMGAGAVSGMIVGKIFGALAGLKPQAQRSLQQVGMWGGLMQTAVPLLFGRR